MGSARRWAGFCLGLATLGWVDASQAAEGKWTPQQVLEQGQAWVKQQGFALPLAKLWDEKVQGGLLATAVQLPGCSGSFVSKDGLLITNHHCIVGILQEHSTPQLNLATDGYLAREPAAEKPAKAYRIQVPRRFVDVTKDVVDAIPANADDPGLKITKPSNVYDAVYNASNHILSAPSVRVPVRPVSANKETAIKLVESA